MSAGGKGMKKVESYGYGRRLIRKTLEQTVPEKYQLSGQKTANILG